MRLKGGMSLRNFMWHGPRNDIIIQNVIYTKWPKEINYQESMRAFCRAIFLAAICVGNRFACPFITAGSSQQGRAERSGTALLHSCLCNT